VCNVSSHGVEQLDRPGPSPGSPMVDKQRINNKNKKTTAGARQCGGDPTGAG